MEQYYHEENFGYLVVKTFSKKCYGLNLKCSNECATAKKIIQDVNNCIVNGWKVARHIQKWFRSYKSRNDFINEICSGEKAILRKMIVTMMTKRITITKKKRKGKRTRKRRRTRRRKMRRKRSRKRKRKKWRRNWTIKMMVTLDSNEAR